MSIEESFDPKDKEKTKIKIKDETAPCNIFGLIGEFMDKLDDIEERLAKLETQPIIKG